MLPGADSGIVDPLLAGRLGQDSSITIVGALTSLNASLGATG
jgi:hypothetical protein